MTLKKNAQDATVKHYITPLRRDVKLLQTALKRLTARVQKLEWKQ